jgi:hypothetical protein
VGAIGGGISMSLWVNDHQEGQSNERLNTSTAYYCSYPYDTLKNDRANTNNNFNCYGDFHNEALDYINERVCAQMNEKGEVSRSDVFHYVRDYLFTISSLCPSGSIDTSKFKIAIYDSILDGKDMDRFSDTLIATDSARLVRCFTQSDKMDSYDIEVYVYYLREIMQMNSFSSILYYTKQYENAIINSGIDATTKDRLKKIYSIQRASLCYWNNALEE